MSLIIIARLYPFDLQESEIEEGGKMKEKKDQVQVVLDIPAMTPWRGKNIFNNLQYYF